MTGEKNGQIGIEPLSNILCSLLFSTFLHPQPRRAETPKNPIQRSVCTFGVSNPRRARTHVFASETSISVHFFPRPYGFGDLKSCFLLPQPYMTLFRREALGAPRRSVCPVLRLERPPFGWAVPPRCAACCGRVAGRAPSRRAACPLYKTIFSPPAAPLGAHERGVRALGYARARSLNTWVRSACRLQLRVLRSHCVLFRRLL